MSYQLNAVRRVTPHRLPGRHRPRCDGPLIHNAATQQDPAQANGWAGGAIAIAAGISRVMALSAVELFLQQ